MGPAQARRSLAQILKRGAYGRKIALRITGERECPVAPFEQPKTELFLQPPDLMADGGLGNVQLHRGLGETEMPGRGLERTKAIEGGKSRHGARIHMRLSHVKRDNSSFVGRAA